MEDPTRSYLGGAITKIRSRDASARSTERRGAAGTQLPYHNAFKPIIRIADTYWPRLSGDTSDAGAMLKHKETS